MLKTVLVSFLRIQELDMEMMRLMLLKKERIDELHNLQAIRSDLDLQLSLKEVEVTELKKSVRLFEGETVDIAARLKKLEAQQSAIKKADEFHALNQEIAQAEKEKAAKTMRLGDLYDKLSSEEEQLTALKETTQSTHKNSYQLEVEIRDRVLQINAEGVVLQAERANLVSEADPDFLRIYEKLFRNKRDRVIVPIENRCCSGCHIMVTAQDENIVRKGERVVFCEHCSRIHYWPESQALEGSFAAAKPQRRRRVAKTVI